MYNRRRRNSNNSDRIIKILFASISVLVIVSYIFIFKNQLLKLPQKYENENNITRVNAEIKKEEGKEENKEIDIPDWIEVDYVEINDYSRPGKKLDAVNGIVIHYTGNPGTTAAQNRNYYGELAATKDRSVSSNFVVGISGEVIACVPEDEVAYASNDRNSDTISIECCHVDKTGKFTDETYKNLVKVAAYLCAKYELNEDQILRHYDITGKECPKYYVKYSYAWDELKEDIMKCVKKEGWK